MKKFIAIAMILTAVISLSGCFTDADIASHNMSKAAEMFEVKRRVVFYNGITGGYMLSVEGLCSIEADSADKQLELTCKTGASSYKKHFLGLSDNVTYFVEQLDAVGTDVFHYRVIFKPQSIIPDIDLETSL